MSTGTQPDDAASALPVVFISYSHDSPEHAKFVASLSEQLRLDGVETILDQYVKGENPKKWPQWMRDEVKRATRVLCVCTETYFRRFEGQEEPDKGAGVEWEGAIITQDIYKLHSKSLKFIPVLRAASDEEYIPSPLSGWTHYLLDAKGYQDLLDALLGRSALKPGPVRPAAPQAPVTVEPLLARKPLAGGSIRDIILSEPVHALVIGISEYAPTPPEESTSTKPGEPFPALKFAADDAKRLHEHLAKSNRSIRPPLLNERATLRGIMRALDELRRVSEGSNPLVMVFFAGHGATDDRGRTYLVPHDGVRNDLFATALWSKTLDNALRQITTNRLVVFLDACHAGGMETEGVRGDNLSCDQRELVPTESGRHVVASCLPKQVSRERDGRGIFSGHLLRLLKFEDESVQRLERLELSALCRYIKERVTSDTDNAQEPWTNVTKNTGIFVAVNEGRRRTRVELEQQLLWKIEKELRDERMTYDFDDYALLANDLSKSIPSGTGSSTDEKLLRLYEFFSQTVGRHSAKLVDEGLSEFCRDLIRKYKGDEGAPARSDTPGRIERPPSVAEPAPAQVALAKQPMAVAQQPPKEARDASRSTLETTPYVSAGIEAKPGQERRCFLLDDAESILEGISSLPAYSAEAAELENMLCRFDGIDLRALSTGLRNMYSSNSNLNELLQEIGRRSTEMWPQTYKPAAWDVAPQELDLRALKARLQMPAQAVDEWLVSKAPASIQDELASPRSLAGRTSLDRKLISLLNAIIHGGPIWGDARFAEVQIRDEVNQLRMKELQGETLERLNRMLLEDAYPEALQKKKAALGAFSAGLRGPHG